MINFDLSEIPLHTFVIDIFFLPSSQSRYIITSSAMEILEKLLKFKVPILMGTTFCLFISFLLYLAPGFPDILKYFWPFLVSRALLLVAVVVLGWISPPPLEAAGEKAGEGILD